VVGAADGGNTADNVTTINGAAIPGIGSSVGGFKKDGIGATIISCNGDGLIQEAVELVSTSSFVVAFGGNVNGNAKKGADGFEG
jgi:hypothetical protein